MLRMMAEKLLFYWTVALAGRQSCSSRTTCADIILCHSWPNANEKTFDETIALLDAKFERKPNLLYERSLFSAMRQQKEESVARFELRPREKAEVCELGDANLVDTVILD